MQGDHLANRLRLPFARRVPVMRLAASEHRHRCTGCVKRCLSLPIHPRHQAELETTDKRGRYARAEDAPQITLVRYRAGHGNTVSPSSSLSPSPSIIAFAAAFTWSSTDPTVRGTPKEEHSNTRVRITAPHNIPRRHKKKTQLEGTKRPAGFRGHLERVMHSIVWTPRRRQKL